MHTTNKRHVLVTGAAGFLGSHISEKLLSLGHTVLGVDDFSTSTSTSQHHQALKSNQNYQFRELDVSEPDAFRNISHVDSIFNMACPASPPAYQKMPMHTLMTCVMGANNCVQLMQRMQERYAKDSTLHRPILIHASTSEIYGNPQQSPQKESYWGNVNSWGSRACYDEGKRAAEAIFWIAKNQQSLDIRLVRIFNTYGPHMSLMDGRVITEFIRSTLHYKQLPVYGNGQQTRSLCYVDDLVDGFMSLHNLNHPIDTPVNLGNDREVTILELARLFQNASCRHVGIKFYPLPDDDPTIRKPDLTLAKSLLNWSPKVSLESGLKLTYEWFKKNQD